MKAEIITFKGNRTVDVNLPVGEGEEIFLFKKLSDGRTKRIPSITFMGTARITGPLPEPGSDLTVIVGGAEDQADYDIFSKQEQIETLLRENGTRFNDMIGRLDEINRVDVLQSTQIRQNGTRIEEIAKTVADVITAHAAALNPHGITKEMLGLSRVDNTSDADKPISQSTLEALSLKADLSALAQKADKSELKGLLEKITSQEKKTDDYFRRFEGIYGGTAVGSSELPLHGQDGQILKKNGNSAGRYKWADYKKVFLNPKLTMTDGVCVWTQEHNLGADVIGRIYEVASGRMVHVDQIIASEDCFRVEFKADTDMAAGTFKLILIG